MQRLGTSEEGRHATTNCWKHKISAKKQTSVSTSVPPQTFLYLKRLPRLLLASARRGLCSGRHSYVLRLILTGDYMRGIENCGDALVTKVTSDFACYACV
jgi:hypothetical protein